MLRKRRRPEPFASDSSDDDTQFLRICKSTHKRPSSTFNSSHRTNEIQEETSDSDFTYPRKNKVKRFRLYSPEEINTTEDEEIVHSCRHGSVRALSDYESGNSSDFSSDATRGNVLNQRNNTVSLGTGTSIPVKSSSREVIKTKSGIFISEESKRSGNISESSSTDSVIHSSQNRKRKRSSNVIYSSDSSESDFPIRSTQRRSNIFHSTDDESNSTNVPNLEIIETDELRSYRNLSQSPDIQLSDSSESDFPIMRRQSKRNSILHSSEDESDSNNPPNFETDDVTSNSIEERSPRSPPQLPEIPRVTAIRNGREDASRRRVMMALRVSPESSNVDIGYIYGTNHPEFDGESSSSDSDEDFPIRNRVRRGAAAALNDSDNDEDNTAENRSDSNSVSQSEQISTVPESYQKHFSDSDSESETCTICLGKLDEQEVGVPSCCNHPFCLVCIQEWSKNNNTCPVDRKQFDLLIVFDKVGGSVLRTILVENAPSISTFVEMVQLGGLFISDEIDLAQSFAEEEDEPVDFDDPEYDGPDEVCRMCLQEGTDDSYMINCDECDAAFHMACVNLNYIPVQDWYCSFCLAI